MVNYYKLRRNKSNASPSNLVFFDCETLPTNGGGPTDYGLHCLNFGYAIATRLVSGKQSRRKVLRFDSTDEFWEFLATLHRKNSCLWVYAHNMGFDATVVKLWERVESGLLKIVMQKPYRFAPKPTDGSELQSRALCILDDPPTVIEVEDSDGNRYKFVDTLNYWRCSLATLGKGIGLEKLQMPDNLDDSESWNTYCLRDVEIIEQSIIGLINWVKSENLGEFRLTSPAQAMASYRHRFMQSDILFHDDLDARKIERESYYGGQVECYFMGKIERKLHQLDVTSLYPSVMRDEYYPWKLLSYTPHSTDSPALPFDRGCDKIARVLIDTSERTYPIRQTDGIYHCSGRFLTTLCGPELDYALQNNHVKHVYDYATYAIRRLFTNFVDFFWAKRKEYKDSGNVMGDLLCKLMMNSLYGKFGQKSAGWVTLQTNPFGRSWGNYAGVNAQTGERIEYRILGDTCQMRVERGELDTAFPAIAAYVTAYGREKMRVYREVAWPSHVYYQAVDAVYVDDFGLRRLTQQNLVGNKELGKLQLVESYENAEFRGINNYSVGTKNVRGSIKQSAKLIGPNTYEEPCFQHLRKILSEPLNGGVQITQRIKHMANVYNRRTCNANQLTTPFFYDDQTTQYPEAEEQQQG